MHKAVTGRGEKGSPVRDDDDRIAARSGEHLRLAGEATDLVADTVREGDDSGEPTEAIPTVQGYLEPPSRPAPEPTYGARALLRASEEVTREARPRTLPPPRASFRDGFVRESVPDRVRQATGRQPVYVPGAVAQREIPRPRESQPPRASMPPRAWQSTPARATTPSRPPPLREDNPITFIVQPATSSKRLAARTPLPWWVAMGVGLSLGLAVASAGFVAWMSAHEPAAAPARVTATTPAAAPVSERAVASPEPPTAPAPRVAAVTPPASGAFTWAATERRMWQGATEGDDNRWSVVLALRLHEDGSVRGYLAWSAVSVQGAREGEQVRENVEGAWDAARGALSLRGTASTNPLVLPVNSYQFHASGTGALRGASLDDGVRVAAALVAPRQARRHHDD
jgi:hypothetical protein